MIRYYAYNTLSVLFLLLTLASLLALNFLAVLLFGALTCGFYAAVNRVISDLRNP